jgi:hypothetical protein
MLEGFEEAVEGRSNNGWMDSELFVSWLKIVFISDIDSRQVKRPVFLLVDGHKPHLTLEAAFFYLRTIRRFSMNGTEVSH